MSRIRYILKRSVISLFLIFVIASILWAFFKAIPGDFATLLVTSGASPEQIEAVRTAYGLNQPLYVQYFRYITNLLTGQLGSLESVQYGSPVWELIRNRLINSFILVGPAIVTAFVLGSIWGALMGTKPGSLTEKYGIIPPSAIGVTPDFFIGILMIFIFATWLGLFPNGGFLSPATYETIGNDPSYFAIFQTKDFWMHYTLPFFSIVLKFLYYPSLIMRSSINDVIGQEFAYYHRITGLPKHRRMRHLMKHASFPVITVFPASMVLSISGLVLIEVVFNWPGIGLLLVDSVLSRDVPVIQFIFLLVAIWIVIGNFVVDIVYSIIDPRISIGD